MDLLIDFFLPYSLYCNAIYPRNRDHHHRLSCRRRRCSHLLVVILLRKSLKDTMINNNDYLKVNMDCILPQ